MTKGLIAIVLMFLVCMSPSLASASDTAPISRGDPEQLLDEFESFIQEKGIWGEGLVFSSAEYQAILEQGPIIIDALIARFSKEEKQQLLYYGFSMLRTILGSSEYVYTRTPRVFHGIDYCDDSLDSLPYLNTELNVYKKPEQHWKELLAWWEILRASNTYAERLNLMREVARDAKGDASAFPPQAYQSYRRALTNYGVYNIPVFITLIKEDNNALAFIEFLLVTRHPAYSALRPTADYADNLKRFAAAYPSQEERLKMVEAWWEKEAWKYQALPELSKAIEKAIKE